MPYTPPSGDAANFQTPGLDFPRPPGGLTFKFGSAIYTAPAGDAIVAQWPAPPADYVRPAGNAADFGAGSGEIVFTGTGAATVPFSASGLGFFRNKISLRAGVTNPWRPSDKREIEAAAPHVPTAMLNDERAGEWGASDPLGNDGRSPWGKVAVKDNAAASPWGAFGDLAAVDHGSSWKPTKRTDETRRSLWSIFGDMLNEDRGGRWNGSKPADAIRIVPWRGHLSIKTRPINYDKPAGNAANFSTKGGGLVFIFGGAYVPPNGAAIPFSFGSGAYSAPPHREPGAVDFVAPRGNAADFTFSPQFEVILDGTGQPAIDKAEVNTSQVLPWGKARRNDPDRRHPWLKYSRPLNPDWGVVTPPGPVEPEPGETVTIPVQRVYIVVNEILLARVDDATPIPCAQLSISIDCDSWLPSFTATIPETSRDAVMPDPTPVAVMAYINGSEFRFYVEKVARSREFGRPSVTISGRGLACELDAPYAVQSQHSNGSAINAQQIIDAALNLTTYTQTWSITDWLVPAGAFSLYGTPAAVAANVAEAAGAVLAADWAARDLRMLPRYKFKPWQWATSTPEYVIPAAITQTESVEWIEKPAYNVVYVSGVQAGVLGQVKITGTAGDKPAPMVTHPLITHADAARQRGTSILSDTGRKALMQISMPVLESTGVIDVCRFVEFSDGANTRRGIVRANNVSVNYPTVRQTLTIEAAA